jgi:hypothetical protein
VYDWLRFSNLDTGLQVYLDINNLAVGANSMGDVAFVAYPDGVLVKIEDDIANLNTTYRFYIAETDGDVSFAGDGVSDGLYTTGFQIREGTLADNIPYHRTTGTPETGKTIHRYEDETPTEERQRLGLKELVGPSGERTNNFKTPIVGEEYFDRIEDGKQIFYQLFEGSGSASTITLLADGHGVTDIHSWSGSAIDSASTPVNRRYHLPNTYAGSTNSSGDVTTGAGTTGLYLDLNTNLQQAGDSYNIHVRYMKG